MTDSKKIAKVTAEYQDWVAKAAAMAQESIGSLRTVRSFAAEQHQVDGYTRLIGEPERPCGPCSPFGGGSALSVAVKRAFVRLFGEGMLKASPGVFLVSINYIGFEGVSNGSLTPGQLLAWYVSLFCAQDCCAFHCLGCTISNRFLSRLLIQYDIHVTLRRRLSRADSWRGCARHGEGRHGSYLRAPAPKAEDRGVSGSRSRRSAHRCIITSF